MKPLQLQLKELKRLQRLLRDQLVRRFPKRAKHKK